MDQVMLPYRTDWRAMAALLDYAKGKGADRAMLEARLGAGESFRETLNALEQLGLVERADAGDVRLTPAGERLAYASGDVERRRELARALLSYPPYAVPLERAVTEGLAVIEGPWVERIWQVDMRLGQPRNRVEEARTFFFRLADDAGLGTYRRGVRGQPTRLELGVDGLERVRRLRAEVNGAPVEDQSAQDQRVAEAHVPYHVSNVPVTLNITIDLTNWEMDKIERLLRLVGVVGPDR